MTSHIVCKRGLSLGGLRARLDLQQTLSFEVWEHARVCTKPFVLRLESILEFTTTFRFRGWEHHSVYNKNPSIWNLGASRGLQKTFALGVECAIWHTRGFPFWGGGERWFKFQIVIARGLEPRRGEHTYRRLNQILPANCYRNFCHIVLFLGTGKKWQQGGLDQNWPGRLFPKIWSNPFLFLGLGTKG